MRAFSYERGRRDGFLRAGFVLLGICVNVLFYYLTHSMGLPIYLDSAGTIFVAATGGLFPGIMTAVASNTICTFFDINSIYFGIVNALIAILVSWFCTNRPLKRIKETAMLIVFMGTMSGVLSALIQWWLLGGPENTSVIYLLSSAGVYGGGRRFLSFIIINIFLNVFDKALTAALATAVLHFIPDRLLERINYAGWRQRPLTRDEKKTMDHLSGDSRYSLKRRMTSALIGTSLMLVLITGIVGVRLYFKNAVAEKKDLAMNAARFAAEVVDADMIDEYIRNGEDVPGYRETEKLLYNIRDNSPGIKYLYLVKIGENGCTFIFDLDEKEEYRKYSDEENPLGYDPGTVIPVEEGFKPYMDRLLKGEEIPVIETRSTWRWLASAYYPVRDEKGRFVCYAGADASLDYVSDYMRDFAIRVFLIMAAFSVLILAYGLWIAGTYMAYPINSMAVAVEDFIGAGNEQRKLDDTVRKMRSIDIQTGDEVEKLYMAICDMAVNQSEQLRGLRRFSENTAKMQDGLIITMADLVENRDSDTGAHIQKTSAYVKIIVEGLQRKGYYSEKITPKFISNVVRSAPLHDVGKINIPDNVLNKPGKLTEEEFEIIKTHTTAGKKIMEKAISTVKGENYLKEARNMAAYHHERWDGKGYPEGLHGEVIPLSARIMAVADVFDALTSPRVYKPAFPFEKALSMIQEGSGTQFDPKCVEVLMESLAEVKVIMRKYNPETQTEVAHEDK
ncbi:MAG: HD domain-containing protein [Lachnospiraceae bacterium]|nr:HD domain-containing protein [Lachnospiraceae bacterium]